MSSGFFSLGDDVYGRRCVIFQTLKNDLIAFADKRVKIHILRETADYFICFPSSHFWSHWNGTNKFLMKAHGLRVLPVGVSWEVFIPKNKVS